MGTWDVAIFDDDIAMDIKDEYESAISEGMSIKAATEYVLECYEEVLEDDDEGPIVYLALASIQLEKGTVLKKIKKRALEIINSGQGLDRWREIGETVLATRMEILNDLKDKLEG